LAITFSEIRVGFRGKGAGAGELTWGQMGIWRATQRNRRNMNLIWPMPLPEETPLAEIVAMQLAMRAVGARTGADGTSVLLAAYSVAVARVFGRNPGVAQIVTSNRFRPGLAGMVSQVSQHGICVVDAAGAAFDEVVARAQKAVTSASFYAYYDPVACDRLLDEIAARRGQPLDISWCLNDRRGRPGSVTADGEVPTGANLAQVLPRTKLYWDRTHPRSDATLFLHVDTQPLMPGQQALAEGRPAVYMKVWADMRHFAHDQVEALVREMEAVAVAAAFDMRVPSCR
jgi:hypothetical protein